jgi:hypothetical protein
MNFLSSRRYQDGQPEPKRRRLDLSDADVTSRLAKSIKKFAQVDESTCCFLFLEPIFIIV